MLKSSKAVSAGLALILVTEPARAQSCSGECDKLVVSKREGCVVLKNISNYRLKVRQTGEIFGSPAATYTIYALSELNPTKASMGPPAGCLRNWDHNYIVDYDGTRPPNTTPTGSSSPPSSPPPPPKPPPCKGRFCPDAPDSSTPVTDIRVSVVNRAPRPMYVMFRKYVSADSKWVSTDWYGIDANSNKSIDLGTRHPVNYITVFDETGCVTTPESSSTNERNVSSPLEDEAYQASFLKLPPPMGNAITYMLPWCDDDGPNPGRLRRTQTNP